MDKNTIISVLIRLLNEKREGLILLNGEWGGLVKHSSFKMNLSNIIPTKLNFIYLCLD